MHTTEPCLVQICPCSSGYFEHTVLKTFLWHQSLQYPILYPITAVCFETKALMHHFHPFPSSFASTAVSHFCTSITGVPCADVGMAQLPRCVTMPTWRAAAQLGCGTAHHHQDTASLTDALQQRHRCWEHFLSRKQTLRGQVRAKGSDPRARLQAAGQPRQPFLPNHLSFLLPPSTTGAGKMHSSEESKSEQLSSNQRFLPPWGCFIKLFVFFC